MLLMVTFKYLGAHYPLLFFLSIVVTFWKSAELSWVLYYEKVSG